MTDHRRMTAAALARQARWALRRGAAREALTFARLAGRWRFGTPAAAPAAAHPTTATAPEGLPTAASSEEGRR